MGRVEVTAQEQPAQESYSLPVLHPCMQTGWNKLHTAPHNCCAWEALCARAECSPSVLPYERWCPAKAAQSGRSRGQGSQMGSPKHLTIPCPHLLFTILPVCLYSLTLYLLHLLLLCAWLLPTTASPPPISWLLCEMMDFPSPRGNFSIENITAFAICWSRGFSDLDPF